MHDGHITLSVSDNGAGVAYELRDRIFDLFRTSKSDGMGVGLWLSRAVMENHRGKLVLDSTEVGIGAKFSMHFSA
jgi:signal transduction histidine kinase